MTIEERLVSLERIVRGQRIAIVLLVLLGGVAVLSGAGGEKEMRLDALQVRNIVVVNDKGEGVGTFGWNMKDDSVALTLTNSSNDVVLRAAKDVTQVMCHTDKRAAGVVVSSTATQFALSHDKTPSVLLGQDSKGPVMLMRDINGKVIWRVPQ